MNHGKHMRYLLIAAGGVAIGLLVAGNSVRSLLPLAFALACPIMMMVMMGGMMRGHGDGGHAGHGAGGCHGGHQAQQADAAAGGHESVKVIDGAVDTPDARSVISR